MDIEELRQPLNGLERYADRLPELKYPHDNAIRAHANKTYSKRLPDEAAYKVFCQFTLEAIASGIKTLGAKAVAERVRWESSLQKTGAYKINNTDVAGFAKRFMAEHPQHQVFRTRGRV